MGNEIAVIEETALTWPEKATAIKIVDQDSYNLAATTLREIADLEKEIKAHHSPMKTAAQTAHKATVAAEKKFLDPLTKAKSIIKGALSGWEVEQRKIREEAQRQAIIKAEKKEEEERLARAEAAEKAGKSETEVDKILDTPKPVTVAPVKPTFESAPGVGTRETWKAEVTDIHALCMSVGRGETPATAIQANMPVLNAMARSAKDTMSVPGVKAVMETGIVTR